MTWEMHDKEFESVLSLPGSQRYTYFIKRVAAWEKIWGLASDNIWAVASGEDGHELFPVWPHERYAAACASKEWAGKEPCAIALTDWME
jgi:hypothetical protein